MKFVYFGTADFAVPPLRAIAEHVCLVVSQPDRPSGRGHKLQPSPVKAAALELGIPVLTPEKCREPEFIAHVAALEPDALIVAAYGQIMPTRLFDTARHGGINLHGSILSKYRGAAPIQRAIMNGETETGVTLMQMDKGMDTGDMIDLVRTPIGPDETYGELAQRLSMLAAEQLSSWAARLASGDYPRQPQDHEQATHAAKIERSESYLSVTRPLESEYCRFRGVTPAPGALLPSQWGDLKIRAARLSPLAVPLGEFLVQQGLFVGFEGGAMELVTLQEPGGKPLSGQDFANGHRIITGTKLAPDEERS